MKVIESLKETFEKESRERADSCECLSAQIDAMQQARPLALYRQCSVEVPD